jgi:excisionase family DNA binding protein
MSEPIEILTSKEACEFLKICRTTLWAAVKDGGIKAHSIGCGVKSSHRFFKADLVAWLKSKKTTARKRGAAR